MGLFMPVTTKIVQLQWSVPTKIIEADKKRLYVRFQAIGEYFFLGGPTVTNTTGIQCSWYDLQQLRAPECQHEFWAVGQCKLRVLEVKE